MAKYVRSIPSTVVADPNSIDSTSYNFQSGGKKNLPVGPHLIPIPTSSTSWTTVVNAAPVGLPKLGLNLAIYNNAGTVGTVTIGNTPTITSQAIGISDAVGNVGVPCPPNSWTYLSMGINQWIVSSAATLFVYIIEDSTFISKEG